MATSAYQVEGGIEGADWTDFEAWLAPAFEGAGEACGHFRHFREDLLSVSELGLNAFRFSVEWSRVQPEEGRWDEEALLHYAEVASRCRELGIEPVVTLHHFTLPRWLARRGGLLAPRFPALFEAFARRVGEAVEATYWITVNEPVVLSVMGYLRGVWPPRQHAFGPAVRAVRALVAAHRAGRRALLAGSPNRRVGIAKNMAPIFPLRPVYLVDHLAAPVQAYLYNDLIPRLLRADLDFMGVNFYTRMYARGFSDTVFARPGEPVTQTGWVVDPASFHRVLLRAGRLGIPLMITENGIATSDDREREAFLKDHVRIVLNLRDRIPILGYLHWSLWDNFEWREGWDKTFGIAPRPTGERRLEPRPSGLLLGQIAKTDGAALRSPRA